MDGAVILAIICVPWALFFPAWMGANNALDSGDYIPRNLMPATLWLAEYALWIPASITILVVVSIAIVVVREFIPSNRMQIDETYDSTDLERDIRKQVKADE